MTITIDRVSPEAVGRLMALYERAVGFYATLIHVNAYHQPGVEAGKKAAASILDLKLRVHRYLAEHKGKEHTLDEIASALELEDRKETLFKLLEHMVVNSSKGVRKKRREGPFDSLYSFDEKLG